MNQNWYWDSEFWNRLGKEPPHPPPPPPHTHTHSHTPQEYMSLYRAELAGVGQRGEEERRGEERWFSNWRTAVQKVKELYT